MIDNWERDSIQEMCETIHGRIDLHNKLENKESAYALYEEWYVGGFDPMEDPMYVFMNTDELQEECEKEYFEIEQVLPYTNTTYKHLDFEWNDRNLWLWSELLWIQ